MFSEFCLQHPEELQCFPQSMQHLSDFAGIWCIVNAVLGFSGNLLTILAIPYAAKRQKFNLHRNWPLTIFILNLAVADLLFVIFCIPFTATDYVLNEWLFGLLVCQAVQYLIYVTSYVSIYTLILMSIDRFLAVVFPVNNF